MSRVPPQRDDLISQIESDALDDSVALATALHKCLMLAGKSHSEALRDWATRELKGYGKDDEVPDYRVIRAPLLIDGLSGNMHVSNQRFHVPDWMLEFVSETLPLRDGVGGLEALLKLDEIKLGPPGATVLVEGMNRNATNPYQHIERLLGGLTSGARGRAGSDPDCSHNACR
jgi:hypothetical protein